MWPPAEPDRLDERLPAQVDASRGVRRAAQKEGRRGVDRPGREAACSVEEEETDLGKQQEDAQQRWRQAGSQSRPESQNVPADAEHQLRRGSREDAGRLEAVRLRLVESQSGRSAARLASEGASAVGRPIQTHGSDL